MKSGARASALRMKPHQDRRTPQLVSRGGEGRARRWWRLGAVVAAATLGSWWSVGEYSAPARAAVSVANVGHDAHDQDPEGEQGAATAPPTWRFRAEDRPVKVVVIAGSIGAWRDHSYAERFETICARVEVKNLSTVGMGAYALKRRFIEQVLRNWNLRWRDPLLEYWLVFQGGLNSVGTPAATNHHIRELFVKAHKRGFGVVGLTLTPWGDNADSKRWGPLTGLDYLRRTQRVVDFVLGNLSPEEALGSYGSRRGENAGAWRPDELADVRVNLYDSPLRDSSAPPRDVQLLRERFASQRSWQRAHKDLDALARAAALERDAGEAATVPQWWLREDLRAFDHIHPNTEGHALISALVCPSLPESWGCTCPTLDGSGGATAMNPAAPLPAATPLPGAQRTLPPPPDER